MKLRKLDTAGGRVDEIADKYARAACASSTETDRQKFDMDDEAEIVNPMLGLPKCGSLRTQTYVFPDWVSASLILHSG